MKYAWNVLTNSIETYREIGIIFWKMIKLDLRDSKVNLSFSILRPSKHYYQKLVNPIKAGEPDWPEYI